MTLLLLLAACGQEPCDVSLWYLDADGDGYGGAASYPACETPVGFVAAHDDCDDHLAGVHPGAAETCDGQDEDCDGDVDEDAADSVAWFPDLDGDGYGGGDGAYDCAQVNATVLGGDCDDAAPDVNPGQPEQCGDAVDQDCDGADARCPLDAPLIAGDQIGATWYGETGDDRAGQAAGGGGDTNGDGRGEGLLGAYREDSVGGRAGAVYVVDTTGGLLTEALAKVTGEAAGDHSGSSVASAGDVDGDGYGDILVGAYLAGTSFNGAGYLVRGPLSGVSSLTDAYAKWAGEEEDDQAGTSIASIGDVDADGYLDWLVGAPYHDGHSGNADDAGAAYVVSGAAQGVFDLADALAAVHGDAESQGMGRALAGGDLDGDGIGDLLTGAQGSHTGDGGAAEGEVYVFYGPLSGDLTGADADAAMIGSSSGMQLGFAVTIAGDLDNDGHPDVVLGAPSYMTTDAAAGGAFVFLGPFAETRGHAEAEATLLGESGGDLAGSSVNGPGDIDGDGNADFLVGAYAQDEVEIDAGATYVVLSFPRGTSYLAGSYARILGSSGGTETGRSLGPAGDVDGDGLADFVLGAPDLSTYENGAGGGYVVRAAELFAAEP